MAATDIAVAEALLALGVSETRPVTVSEIATMTGFRPERVRLALLRLKRRGMVVLFKGRGRGLCWRIYPGHKLSSARGAHCDR